LLVEAVEQSPRGGKRQRQWRAVRDGFAVVLVAHQGGDKFGVDQVNVKVKSKSEKKLLLSVDWIVPLSAEVHDVLLPPSIVWCTKVPPALKSQFTITIANMDMTRHDHELLNAVHNLQQILFPQLASSSSSPHLHILRRKQRLWVLRRFVVDGITIRRRPGRNAWPVLLAAVTV
jgi:hypothetical protein